MGETCASPSCADDITQASDDKQALQSLISESEDYAGMERYLIQPVNSVIMHIKSGPKKATDADEDIFMAYQK